ncbi:hypothetical protein [Paractinoplanes globisporus]|uniref:Uncharacterized protein n=1 Tax=Paractinoplanes globisporus TaxID=113565 RepID=A0ABW6WFR8_9ACTN|nr:hypothetical protein [Actinoplanes globisporus]
MPLHVITVYHNTSGRFRPYTSADTLREVISHCRELPAIVELEQVAEWLFNLFNADLEALEQARENPGGESGFLLACTYRLLRLRSLSVGDVVAITAGEHTTWLSCDPAGWRRIVAPEQPARQTLVTAIGEAVRTRRHG